MKWITEGKKVCIGQDRGILEVSFPKTGGARFQYGHDRAPVPWCPVLQNEPELYECRASLKDWGLLISGGSLSVCIMEDGSISVHEAAGSGPGSGGRADFRMPAGAFQISEDLTRMRFVSEPEAIVYGLGQDPAAKLDHNHQERRMWNQWGGHARSGNCGIGFFISTGGFGMLLATPADARFCFNESEPQPTDSLGEAMVPSAWAPAAAQPDGTACVEVRGPLDIFLLFGTADAVLRHYYQLTGFPGLMPKWAYGYLQCKNRYMNRDDLMVTARRLREAGLPCDGLIIDWLWFKEFGDMDWRKDDWPDAEKMLEKLGQMGFHVISAQHPFISETGRFYGEYAEKGYLNRVPEGKRVTYDHTNPKARRHWWEKCSRLYRQGLGGYWTDMGELEEHFDGTESFAGGRAKTHNAYSLLWAQGLYEGQKRDFGTRAFILSRSGCAGIQKYGTAVWSGDINASWQVLKDQVVLGQTMAVSGIPWWGTDIGGFLSGSECTPELYVRWMEWGVFCGIFRTHGTRPGNEPWSFGTEAGDRIHELIRLRYRLLPYIYSLAIESAINGTMTQRPLALAFTSDAQAAACTGTFMLGPSVLVSPVTEKGVRSAEVYLPEGEWYHWWSGKKYQSGWHSVPAPPGQVPFFIRAGSLLPVYEQIGENAASCSGLCLLDFTDSDTTDGQNKGVLDYYDDDGRSFDYRKGYYTYVHFSKNQGNVRAVPVSGKVPVYTVKKFSAQDGGVPAVADCEWQADSVQITLTFLRDGRYSLDLTPEEGWYVTACSAGGCGYDLEEPAYLPAWKGEISGKAGEYVRWELKHTHLLYRVGVQKAALAFAETEAGGKNWRITAAWDGPYLSTPAILGCLPYGASEKGFCPEKDPEALAYIYEGRTWHWMKDVDFMHNCFGYVDFRRFDPQRLGEAMMGEAWARENLYSKTAQKVEFELRYDSPVVIWLNGKEIFVGDRKNEPCVRINLELRQGKNVLVIRQKANIERPYSGGEFGYQMKLISMHKIFVKK